MIYLIIWFFGIIPAFFPKNLKINKMYYIFYIIFFMLIFGFRYDVGKDYMSYYNIALSKFNFNESELELFFKIIYYLIDLKIFSVSFLFLLTFSITTFFVFKTIRNYSKNYLISFSIYFFGPFFLFSLSGIRQALAASIFFCSIKFIIERKFFSYSLVILFISVFFHYSAIFLLPLYFLYNLKLKKYKIIIMYFFSLFILIFGYQILESVIVFLYSNIDIKYTHYLISRHGITYSNISFNALIFRIFKFIIILPFIEKLRDNKLENFIIIIYILYLMLDNVFFYVPILRRFNIYFYFSEFIIISNNSTYIKDKHMNLYYKFIIISIYLLYFFNDLLFNTDLNILPFKLIGAI